MAEVVYMPKLSDTMTEGVVAAWTKNVGDAVKSGEVLAEIETDKATMEFESFYDGVLLHIGVETGKTAPVNSILAIIGAAGEDISALLAAESAPSASAAPEPAPAAAAPVAAPVSTPAPSPAPVVAPAAAPVAVANNSDRVFASPLAKKMAAERGIDIQAVGGTGENGRIVKRDVDHYVPYTPAANAPTYSAAPMGTVSYTDEPVSQMRKTIARRLAESKFTAPHFYLTLDIDMDAAMAIRKGLNSLDGVKVSFNDMVIKAVAMALRKHPAVNSAWMGDFIRRNDHVNIGVAVAVEDGLLVPVVRFADGKGLTQISAEVREFAQKAKDKKLQPSDWEGNTFTISNLGMFGIESFTAIVNPPDACILAIGGIKAVPVVKNGQVVPGNVMKVTLSCDHRAVDGASGAAFLQTFKTYMEQPAAMLL
ncbi:MAG: pyruvate dehydrogenase complex dihydrolipoamide acetyltransferase [Crocinitomicaceae bacterium]|jgi:pyruvate dehydrogenase E2 component (dihydrolipoamide acetyltransferase)|nr:pyruvate dehydrogenase complex dihydrolipoamide acetyltransferase [Crocinitomicaceae bacterium]MDP4723031.1 pyruvate dehydrogenase complex dihydrolipoamide acetyltransferase [Crocinitomicaceae bacterium]MDP4739617.1 pyruvate dehydrogenase complex dihydrolipoamide acetyltransferase [Crocinitomicaceae bacterium]MDP4800306.1 pyruvate dehydrogenase complex dihydrolipoamide acetyltransferase [Crocinitomicaceae bacterium]MDP4806641.1 pyruvate dehydrogenase complex dihydrolipoamide acetyltransferas